MRFALCLVVVTAPVMLQTMLGLIVPWSRPGNPGARTAYLARQFRGAVALALAVTVAHFMHA